MSSHTDYFSAASQAVFRQEIEAYNKKVELEYQHISAAIEKAKSQQKNSGRWVSAIKTQHIKNILSFIETTTVLKELVKYEMDAQKAQTSDKSAGVVKSVEGNKRKHEETATVEKLPEVVNIQLDARPKAHYAYRK